VIHFFVYLASHFRRPPVFLLGLTPIPLPPSPKSFPLNPFADPHTLNPYAAILYKKMAGEGPSQHTVSLKFFPCHRSENSPVSPAVATLPKTPYRKSFLATLPSPADLWLQLTSRNGYALPAAMGVAAKRARRLQERRSSRLPCSRLKRLTALQSPKAIDCLAVKGIQLSAGGGGGGAPGPPLKFWMNLLFLPAVTV